MPVDEQTAAMVALLRAGGRGWARYVVAARQAGGASAVDPRAALDDALGLLAYDALQRASAEVEELQARGIRVLSLSDPQYPANLAVTSARPPLLFVRGELQARDAKAAAVIGTRTPSEAGRALAQDVTRHLVAGGFTVFSGLAAGIDAEAHRTALTAGGRTVAVIGTGLDHAYPPEHAELQRQIATLGAVVSQFWPATPPSRESFPARNAVMSGMTLASIIVEASATSGTRIQARHAIDQGRAVILMRPVLENDWAGDLAQRAGVHVAEGPADVMGMLGG